RLYPPLPGGNRRLVLHDRSARLQHLARLDRIRELAQELVLVVGARAIVPERPFDLHREEQHFRRRLVGRQVALQERARLQELLLAVHDEGSLDQRLSIGRVLLERTPQVAFRAVEIGGRREAHAGVRERDLRVVVVRGAGGALEMRDGVVVAFLPAKPYRVRIAHDVIARCRPHRLLVVLGGEPGVVQALVGERQHGMRDREVAVELDRPLEPVARELVIAVLEVTRTELVVLLGRLAVVHLLRRVRRGRYAGRQQRRDGKACKQLLRGKTVHAVATFGFFSLKRVRIRSLTLPANWPQAASMSSPRVRRTVVTRPCRRSRSWNAATASGGERRKRVRGKGLKGIRLTFAGRLTSRRASCSACASESFTPPSMTYSKVMKRPACREA